MFLEVIYNWLLGIFATAGVVIFVVLIIFLIILGIQMFFD